MKSTPTNLLLRKQQFIDRANNIHNYIYDYSSIVYINNMTPIDVICKEHGVFTIVPNYHISKRFGCPICTNHKTRKPNTYINKKYTLHEIITKCNTIHNNKYDYSQFTVYNKMHEQIPVICPMHGVFHPNLSDHINRKAGCPKCAGRYVRTLDEIVAELHIVHNNRYLYDLTDPINQQFNDTSSYINIICKEHGVFNASINCHLYSKSGCPTCAELCSYDNYHRLLCNDQLSQYEGSIYCIKITTNDETFIKVGFTTNIESRMKRLQYNIGLTNKCELIKTYGPYNLKTALFVEQNFHIVTSSTLKHIPKIIFGGHTECYNTAVLLTIDTDISDLLEKDYNKKYIIIPYSMATNKSHLMDMYKNKNNKRIFMPHEVKDETKIKSLCGDKITVFGRKTICKPISSIDGGLFLSKYHVQGNINATFWYGIYFNQVLIAVSCLGNTRFNNTDGDYELYRFCCDDKHTVLGGLNKMLSLFKQTVGVCKIITYSDNRWSLHSVYESNNFKFIRTTTPGYYYHKDGLIYNRMLFQKHKLSNKLPLFDQALSESINMANNGYQKVYDCGQSVFVKQL